MKAIIKEQRQNGRNLGGKKEIVNQWKVVGTHPEHGIITVVDARAYMGRSRNASVVYASLRVHAPSKDGQKEIYTAGHGSAGGYGYHKESAAIEKAITSAGIELYGSPYASEQGDETKRAHIGGCGSSSLEAALVAIAKACGYSDATLV